LANCQGELRCNKALLLGKMSRADFRFEYPEMRNCTLICPVLVIRNVAGLSWAIANGFHKPPVIMEAFGQLALAGQPITGCRRDAFLETRLTKRQSLNVATTAATIRRIEPHFAAFIRLFSLLYNYIRCSGIYKNYIQHQTTSKLPGLTSSNMILSRPN
jgi:hypothetical protein